MLPEVKKFEDTIEALKPELISLGWQVQVTHLESRASVTLHRYRKNGTPLKGYDVWFDMVIPEATRSTPSVALEISVKPEPVEVDTETGEIKGTFTSIKKFLVRLFKPEVKTVRKTVGTSPRNIKPRYYLRVNPTRNVELPANESTHLEVMASTFLWAARMLAPNRDAAAPAPELKLSTLLTPEMWDYLRSVGVEVPPDITITELRDLKRIYYDHDKPATDRHKSFAGRYGVQYTRFTGKKTLFRKIFETLIQLGKQKDLVAWFTYRVYRHLVKGAENVPIKSPDDPAIQEVAEELVKDQEVVKSIHRYEEKALRGNALIWFGDYKGFQGCGTNTTAFKRVKHLLDGRF